MARSVQEVLAACPLFAAMDDASRQRLADLAVVRRYEAGQMIFRQDAQPVGVFIVDDGRVKVYRLSPQGREHVLHLCGPNGTFAEVAVFGEFALPATASATEATTCVLLPTGPLLGLLRSDHGVCLELLRGISRLVRRLVGLMEDIVLRDAAGRVARYLLDAAGNGDIATFTTTKRDVASHLNLTSETLSRVLRRMSDAGLIEAADDGAVRLCDIEMLRQVVDGLFPKI